MEAVGPVVVGHCPVVLLHRQHPRTQRLVVDPEPVDQLESRKAIVLVLMAIAVVLMSSMMNSQGYVLGNATPSKN